MDVGKEFKPVGTANDHFNYGIFILLSDTNKKYMKAGKFSSDF